MKERRGLERGGEANERSLRGWGVRTRLRLGLQSLVRSRGSVALGTQRKDESLGHTFQRARTVAAETLGWVSLGNGGM